MKSIDQPDKYQRMYTYLMTAVTRDREFMRLNLSHFNRIRL